jgi:hypothetical protein
MSIPTVRQHRLRPELNAFAIVVAACPLLALLLSVGLLNPCPRQTATAMPCLPRATTPITQGPAIDPRPRHFPAPALADKTALPGPSRDRGVGPQTDAQPTEEPQRHDSASRRRRQGQGLRALFCHPSSARRSSSVHPSRTIFGLGSTGANQQGKKF